MGAAALLRLLGAASVVTTLAVLARLARSARSLARDFPFERHAPPPGSPLVSVLVPARNEEKNIGACLRSLLAQDHPRLEVLLWDDGSEDATGVIARDLAAADPRLRLFRGEGPPPGWIAKCWALDRLARAARGEWLLFADADTFHAPVSISAGLAYARAHGLAALSCAGERIRGSFWERAWEPLWPCFLFWWIPPDRVNDPDAACSFAIGQWFLFSRAAYAAIGGHEAVKAEIVEDCALARALKRARVPFRVLLSTKLFRVRMYTRLGEIWEGWSKNAYRALALAGGGRLAWPGSVAALALVTLAPFAVALAALGGLAPGLGPLAAYGPALFALLVSLGLRVRERAHPALFWTLPLAGALAVGVLVNSGVRALTGRNVAWKGRSYPGGVPAE